MVLAKFENTLFFLVILFLPTQLGKHFWPQFSFIYSLKIDYLSPTLYFWDILVIGLLSVWLLKKPRIHKTALSLFLFFLLTQLFSLFNASNLGASFVRLEQYVVAGFFGLYIASQKFGSTLSRVWLPLALGILGESILAILQFIKGSTLGLWILGERTFSISTPGIAKFDFYGMQFLRPYATFPHPNVLAGYLLVGIVLVSFWGVRHPVGRLQNLDSGLAALARMTWFVGAALTIFITMSRTAILTGIILLILTIRKKGLILLVGLLLVLSPILFARFASLVNFDSLAVLRREELVANAWQIFLQSPIFGVGLNNFIPAQADNLITGPSRFLQPAHNIFLLVLSETGIIGLIGFICLIGYPIRKILNSQSSILNLIPWFIILFLGLFDHYFLTLPQGYRLLFLVWGLSFSIAKQEN